jgi:hypothetical protein
MLLRASLRRCAVTWISPSMLESASAARTEELEAMRMSAVAAHHAAGALEKLGIWNHSAKS